MRSPRYVLINLRRPVEQALALLQQGAGSHFDPHLIALFMHALPEILAFKDQYSEREERHN